MNYDTVYLCGANEIAEPKLMNLKIKIISKSFRPIAFEDYKMGPKI